MLKVALIGHDTRNPNLGVGALTVSDAETIRRIAARLDMDIRITLLIGKGGQACCVTGEDVSERFVRPMRRPLDFFSAIRENDVVIDISGGDSFADIYGDRRIFQILLQKYLVHLARRPLVMAPQTVGPFAKPLWRRLASGSIRRCAIIATRDDKSAAFLREMGIRQEIVEASDVALRLPYDAPAAPETGTGPKVGLNVSGLLMGGGYTGKNMFGLKIDYPALIRDIIKRFQAHPEGCEMHLVGHVVPQKRGGVEDDYQACLDLAKDFPRVVVAPPFQTPSEAKSYIAGLDFFMGARMHACIAAFSSGVPVVPMAYSRKFEGLFGSLGYDWTVDCTTNSAEEILMRVFKAYDARDLLTQQMAGALATGLSRLDRYEIALEKLLVGVY
ncbi:polysaccharide pyruvyl transferase family protein [Sedimentitalea sp. JM2-8]|uniref:Polysaccharide pyruvyl transferase family protein n=1 Tax=Sedimentitalea xiamensis TaxID=3050037 RepID=A0ABT7FHE8_9RHOB|nr:polysaccharide pyruvyl transferase family protein [Sedimentitalea xiamensis]MDK3074561.1 polysaccharide pyruvyl transferase family protein [Sedimentitalea xiamensis]